VAGAPTDLALLHRNADDLRVLLRERLGGVLKDVHGHDVILYAAIGGGGGGGAAGAPPPIRDACAAAFCGAIWRCCISIFCASVICIPGDTAPWGTCFANLLTASLMSRATSEPIGNAIMTSRIRAVSTASLVKAAASIPRFGEGADAGDGPVACPGGCAPGAGAGPPCGGMLAGISGTDYVRRCLRRRLRGSIALLHLKSCTRPRHPMRRDGLTRTKSIWSRER